jgi:hypothetical protein
MTGMLPPAAAGVTSRRVLTGAQAPAIRLGTRCEITLVTLKAP